MVDISRRRDHAGTVRAGPRGMTAATVGVRSRGSRRVGRQL